MKQTWYAKSLFGFSTSRMGTAVVLFCLLNSTGCRKDPLPPEQMTRVRTIVQKLDGFPYMTAQYVADGIAKTPSPAQTLAGMEKHVARYEKYCQDRCKEFLVKSEVFHRTSHILALEERGDLSPHEREKEEAAIKAIIADPRLANALSSEQDKALQSIYGEPRNAASD
jgi:hypothetical protein